MHRHEAVISPLSRRIFGYESESATVVASFTVPETCGVLIIGPSGVGKTTVMNAALAQTDPSVPVIRLRGSHGAQKRNLGIFEILLSQAGYDSDLPPGRSLSVLSGIVAERAGRSARTGRPQNPAQPQDRGCIHDPAQTQSPAPAGHVEGVEPLLVVDNADLVDEHSLAVVARLAESGLIRVLVSAESVRPPLDVVADLWTAGRLARVDLEGIGEAAAVDMIAAIGMLDTETRSPSELYDLSHGNPRLLERLIYGSRRSLGGDNPISRADPMSTDLIEMVSLMEAIPYDTVVRLFDAVTVDALAARGLITVSRGRRALVRIREPVVSENIRDAVRPSRSLQLFKHFAGRVDAARFADDALLGFVGWSLSLGETQPAELVRSAAEWANGQGRYGMAADLIRTRGCVSDELALELCRAERALGHFAEARAILDRLLVPVDDGIGSAGADADDAVREGGVGADAQYLSRLGSIDLRLCDPRQPEPPRTEWIRSRLTQPDDWGRLDVTRARFELKAGDLAQSRRLSAAVYGDHTCSVRHRLRACAFLGVAEVMAGRIESGLAYIDHAKAMFELPGLTSFEDEDAAPQFFIAYYIAGEWDSARRAIGGRLKSSRRLKDLTAALVDANIGEVERAHAKLQSLLTAPKATDLVDISLIARAALDCTAVATGAQSNLVEVGHEDAGDVSLYSWWAEVETRQFRLQALAQRSPDIAAEEFLELGHSCELRGAHALAVRAWIAAASHGLGRAVPLLARAAENVDGGLGQVARIVGLALTTESIDDLIAAARISQDFGATALASSLATTARTEAVAARDSAAAKEARRIIGHNLRNIEFDTAEVPPSAKLSDIERALVDGVDAGSTSATLGRQLHLSARTVEWHLGRIYRKLHVADRPELRAVVRAWRAQGRI